MTRRFLIAYLFTLPIQGQLVLDKKEISILGIRVNFLVDEDEIKLELAYIYDQNIFLLNN